MSDDRRMWTTLGLALLALLLAAPPRGLAAQGPTSTNTAPKRIDDFEDGDLEAPAGLSWLALSDEQFGGTSTARAEVVAGGANGSKRALRLTGRTTEESRFPMSSVWVPVRGDGLPVDLGAYQGIRFWARGSVPSFLVGVRRGKAQVTNFGSAFSPASEWKRVEVPFSALKQTPPFASPQAWSPADVMWVGFSTPPGFVGEFTVDVDEVELY